MKFLQKKRIKLASSLGLVVAWAVNMPAPAVLVNAANENANLPALAASNTKTKTNFVYIVLDDMGFSDFGCYGSEIKTPNIDKLAADGLVYNNFNVCPVCSPTRASLLTGRENNAVGMGHITNLDMGPEYPNLRAQILPKAATVAQILQRNGYSTLGVGKWHLTPMKEINQAGPFQNWPLQKGFDRFYGFLGGNTDQYSPLLINGNEQISSPVYVNNEQFSADMTDKANQYLTDQFSIYPDKPFFLYAAFSAVHSPLEAPKRYIEMYNGVYDQGYDRIREARFEKQKKLGLIPADAKLTPRDAKIKPWGALTPDEKLVSARFMQVYAGFLSYADEQVGKLVAHLKATGQYDNTMIMVIADNGAASFGGDNGCEFDFKAYFDKSSLDFLKKHVKDFGGSTPFGGIYPKAWANVSNTPFANYKGTVFAGGTRTPLIIHWPNGIKVTGNHVRNQYVHITDITPTVLDIAHVAVPETFNEVKQLPMDGTSLVSTFADAQAPSTHGAQYYFYENNRSIAKDGWKAIALHKRGTSFEQDQWQLYNLNEDFSETTDLAAQYPEKLKELQGLWQSEASRHGTPLREVNQSMSFAPGKFFKYYPGTGSIIMLGAPAIFAHSYTITVPVNRTAKSQEGVLVSAGGGGFGYTLYVKKNRVVYEYNYFGNFSRIEAPLPLGKALIEYKFENKPPLSGTGRMYVDGKLVGETQIAKQFLPNGAETMDIGRDRYSQVSADYKGEFPFTGQYDYVQFEIK